MNIDLKYQLLGDKEFVAQVAKLNDKELDKALRRTITQVNTTVRKSIKTEVREHYTLKSNRIAKDTPKTIFKRNGTQANISTKEKPITLRAYGGRMTRKGYSSSPLRGQRQVINRSFTITRTHTLPFMRLGKPRYPIKGALKGPSLHRILTAGRRHKQISKAILETGDARFLKVLRKEVATVLRGF